MPARSSDSTPQLVYVDTLAQHLSVSHWWVRRAVHEGHIPYFKVGRHLRFDVDAVVASQAVDPAKPPAPYRLSKPEKPGRKAAR